MKQILLIICESVIIEKDTNKVSLLSLFERIITTGTPTIYPRFSVFTRFEDGEGQHDHKIVVRNSSGNILAELPGKINFSGNKGAQYIGNFQGLLFPEFGEYKVEIYLDNILQPLTGNIEVVRQ